MRCYFNLVSSHHTITDEEGLEVANLDEARTFAHEAVAEMVQDGVGEIAHWRGWEMEARDAAGTVLGGFKWSSQHGLCDWIGGTGPEPRPVFSSPGSFAACC
jgi:hypothetical protein